MPFKSDVFVDASLMLVDMYGTMTLEERYESLAQALFAIHKQDVRHLVVDLSMMSAQNNEIEELIFAEELARHARLLDRAKQTIIHSTAFNGTIIPAKYMIREGIEIDEFDLKRDKPGITRPQGIPKFDI